MDVREIVRLKEGVGGLSSPFNYGILMDRIRSGKSQLLKIFTINGDLTVKSKLIKEGTGKIYKGDKTKKGNLKRFLEDFIDVQKKKNILRKDPSQITNENSPADIWRVARYRKDRMEAIPEDMDLPGYLMNYSLTPEDAAKLLYPDNTLNPGQIKAVGKILSEASPRSKPYFEMIRLEKKSRYVPYDPESVKGIEEHIIRLNEMKSHFVEWVEEEEGERRKKVPRLICDDISQVDLPDGLREERDRIMEWSRFYLENGRWPDRKEDPEEIRFGLGGTPVSEFEKFSLERFVGYFAMDLTRSKSGDTPSNLLSLLLKMREVSWKEASDLVVSYHISTGASRFRKEFPRHILDEAGDLPSGVEPEETKGRRDLTHLETYTIDPDDAKDFDDAISLERSDEGFVVWVHIADVSHYVRPYGLMDTEAKFRSTSVYLPTGVIPMLPARLSEDLCSLREGVKRLALTTKIMLDGEGNVSDWEHMSSVVMVDKNLAYGEVEDWIEEGIQPFSDLWNISGILEKKHERLRLETPERKIRFTSDNSIDIQIKRPTKATRLIEQLMVITNECSARFLRERGIKIPFRVHPMPDKASVESFNSACSAMGSEVRIEPDWGGDEKEREDISGGEGSMMEALLSGGKISIGGAPDPADKPEVEEDSPVMKPMDPETMREALDSFNSALDDISKMEDRGGADILRMYLLRAMQRAFYSIDNLGHFGLASECYCHFTSPIRRYPDIMVHRAIKKVLAEDGKGPDVDWELPDPGDMDLLVEGINEMTQMSDDWERQMVDVALVTRASMEEKFFNGSHRCRITSLTPGSCFLLLDDGATEGRIPVSKLSHHSVDVDETQTMVLVSLSENPEFIDEHEETLTTEELQRGMVTLHRLGDRMVCSIYDVKIVWGKIELKP